MSAMPPAASLRRAALRIALGYALAAALWIAFSDRLLGLLGPHLETVRGISMFKGWFFVSVTAVLLYFAIARQLRRERAAAAEREKLARLLEHSRDFVAMADLEGRITFMNPRARAMIGLAEGDDARALHCTDYVPEAGREFFRNTAVATARERGLWEGEMQWRHLKTGAVIDVFPTIFLVRDAAGAAVGFASVTRDITAEKRAREALEAERALLRTAIDTLPHSIYVKDRESRFVLCNEACARNLGETTAADLLGKSDADFLPAPTAARCREREVRVLQGETLDNLEEMSGATDGTVIVMLTTKIPLRGADGSIKGLVGTGRDISESKAAEEALRRSERDFRVLFDRNPMPMWVYYSGDLRFLAVNEAAVEHYGYARAEFLGMSIKDIRPPEDAERLVESVRNRPPGLSHAGVWRHRKKDGTIIFVDIASHAIDFQGREAVLVLAKDVTDLRVSEERFRQVVESIRDVFWMLDVATGRVLYVSPAYETVWGRSCESLYAAPRSWTEPIHPDDKVRVLVAQPNLLRGNYDENYRIVRPDGAVRWIHDQAYPVKGADGTVQRIVGVAEDVTAERELETKLLRAQRLEAIGTLSSGIAHDLNNILAPVLMAAGLLRSEARDARSRELLEMVESGAHRGANVIRQLLTFSRGVEGARVAVQVRHLMKEMAEIARETFPRNIAVSDAAAGDLRLVSADATQLHQVLMNLCVNARDAMPGGGTLELRAENAVLTEGNMPAHAGARAGAFVRLTVTDTGRGIPPEISERIFDPFFTTKGIGEGSGLGLSTALGIVKSHGGFIALKSAPGEGAAFSVFLPAAADGRLPAAPVAKSPRAPGRGETVLVIDDEALIRQGVSRTLEPLNYRIVTAGDGREGLEVFRRHRAEIRLVVIDLMMPVMGGSAAIRALQAEAPDIRIVVMSGMVPESERAGLHALGLREILMKPFGPDELVQTVAAALAR
jgi:PAS domain S-box-containing protein